MAAVLSVGDSFETYEQFRDKLNEYMQTVSGPVRFYRRDVRTVTAARRRLTRPLNDRIKYYDIRYCCVNDGVYFKSRRQPGDEAS